jgi:hypothetical protein
VEEHGQQQALFANRIFFVAANPIEDQQKGLQRLRRGQGLGQHSLGCELQGEHVPAIPAGLFQVQIQSGHGILSIVRPKDRQEFLSTSDPPAALESKSRHLRRAGA